MKRHSILLATAILWFSTAQAHTFIYDLEDGAPVFRIEFPDGWRLDLDFDPEEPGIEAPPPPRVVEAIPKDGAKLWLGIWVVDEITGIGEARSYFDSLEAYILTDVVVESSEEAEHNGMSTLVLKGSARKDSEAVEWLFAFFEPKDGIVAAMTYVGVEEARTQRQSELDSIFDSVSPAEE